MLAEDDLIFSKADNQILPAKEAFGFNFIKSSGNIIATWNVKKDYYLYLRSVSVKDIDGEITYKILKGDPIDYKDEFFGDTKIIKDILEISYEESHQKGKTKIYYQGCSEKGFCYPVQSINIK